VHSVAVRSQSTSRQITGARAAAVPCPSLVELEAAVRLHDYLVDRHWSGSTLVGPDPGIRFNYRIGRFIKSYISHLDWGDNYYYLQCQGYWTLGNWRLFDQFGDDKYRHIAVRCSTSMLDAQRADGAWDYPNPEWRGRVATVEGTWASIGLLETYRRTADASFLDGALRWHRFLIDTIRFQRIGDTLAANYFAHCTGDVRVPANASIVLRFLTELAHVTGDRKYAEQTSGLLRFFQSTQMASGEFPYAVSESANRRDHFQCYQYNAFLCLDLIRCYELSGDDDALALARNTVSFLSGGVAPNGHAFYACGNGYRAVTYHAAALGAVLRAGWQLGFVSSDLSDRAFAYVRARQRSDGGFPYSERDYRALSDRRSYPRYLAMILLHLLGQGALPGSPAAQTSKSSASD
jgi:hypothetical protein